MIKDDSYFQKESYIARWLESRVAWSSAAPFWWGESAGWGYCSFLDLSMLSKHLPLQQCH